MDRLRRLVRSSGNGGRGEGEPVEVARTGNPEKPAKLGGHGDHWGCIFRQVDEGELFSFIQHSIEHSGQPQVFKPGTGKSMAMAIRSDGDPLCACMLVEDDRLATAYPEALGGVTWPVAITEVVPWANGIEGQISGTCHGAAISFFDTRFYANRERYRPGNTHDFLLNAFAYVLNRAPEMEVESEVGAKVSLSGARAYMPAHLSSESADIDDFWFHSPLEGEPVVAELAGKRLRGYPVTLALPDEFDMSVTLYAAEHVLGPDLDNVRADEDLEGFLWLQGYLKE